MGGISILFLAFLVIFMGDAKNFVLGQLKAKMWHWERLIAVRTSEVRHQGNH